ncbi:hypothetical protein J3E74DRAFT_361419 [Bipolaris maydis]|nr:hypothetical protein J3E74DRAFT_361419 [Bipolaris maydis]
MTTFFLLSCPFVLIDSVSRPRSSFFHLSNITITLRLFPLGKIFFCPTLFFASLLSCLSDCYANCFYEHGGLWLFGISDLVFYASRTTNSIACG